MKLVKNIMMTVLRRDTATILWHNGEHNLENLVFKKSLVFTLFIDQDMCSRGFKRPLNRTRGLIKPIKCAPMGTG